MSVAIPAMSNALSRENFPRQYEGRASGDGSTCGSGKRGVYNTPAHVMALFLILILSTLAFVSLTDPCLPRFWSQTYRAMAGFVAMISVFVVVLVEMFFAMKGAGHVHGIEYDQLIGDAGPNPSTDDHNEELSYLRLDGIESADNINPSNTMHSVTQTRNSISRNSSSERHQERSVNSRVPKDDDNIPLGESYRDDISPMNGNHGRSLGSHGHRARATSQPEIKLSMHNPQRQLLQCLLLEAGILFHSIFIGMAVSVATGTSFVVLLVAICFHQTFEGFALGSRIASLIPDLFPPSSIKPWLMSLAYGTTTPIGQAIGLVLHNLYDPGSTTGLLMVGITNAISSGLLLFAGLVELLAEDFLSETSYATLQGQRRFEACIAVAAGALLMAFVGAFA